MVVIDATMLLLLLRPGTPVPAGPSGIPVDKPKERIDYLVGQLERERTKIIVPTPALSEAMVRAGPAATQQIIEYLQRYSVFRIEPFDTRAAIEVAAMTRGAIDSGKKRGDSTATYAKLKYDRQIMAIARVSGAEVVYSDDGDIRAMAKGTNVKVVGISELPLPPEDAQHPLPLSGADPSSVRSDDGPA